MLKLLKRIYLRIGIHAAPPGTLFFSLHHKVRAIARPFVSKARHHQPREGRHTPGVTIEQRDLYHFPVRKIAIVKGDHIGDLVLAIPAIKLLRKGFPDASFTLICNECNESLALATGLFEKVVVAPLDTEARQGATLEGRAETSKIVGALSVFDIAIDMKAEADTRYVLQHLNARVKAGFYADSMPRDNAIILPPIPEAKEVRKCNLHNREILCLLAKAVITRFHLQKEDATRRVLDTVARDHANKKLWNDHAGPIIGINTGAGRDIKCWPLSRYVTLCRDLIGRFDARIVLFGTREESNDAVTIISACNHANIEDMTGRLSLTEFVGAMRELDLFIGHDTGTTHIAAAIGRPTLCLFPGVTSYDRFAPKGDRVTVIRSHVACSPCGIIALEECHHDHACMNGIAVDDVVKTAVRILGRKPNLVSVPRPEAHEVEKKMQAGFDA